MFVHGQLDPTRTVGVTVTYHESSPVLVIIGKISHIEPLKELDIILKMQML